MKKSIEVYIEIYHRLSNAFGKSRKATQIRKDGFASKAVKMRHVQSL